MFGACVLVAAATLLLPSHFSGNLVFLTPTVSDGRSLNILLDTGGYDLIAPGTVDSLGLPTAPVSLGSRPRATVAFPKFLPGASIPVPATRWLIARPEAFASTFALNVDATLGASWFASGALSIDYRRQQVALESISASQQTVSIEVKSAPPPVEQLPGETLVLVPVSVGGESLSMLLDTGATARIRPEFRTRMPDASAVRQVSFASRSLVERWHREHPDWPFVPNGAELPSGSGFRNADMIRVDVLSVGMRRAPPTWFLARSDDETFADLTKAFGRPVAGDLGGDAFREWKITIDLGSRMLGIGT